MKDTIDKLISGGKRLSRRPLWEIVTFMIKRARVVPKYLYQGSVPQNIYLNDISEGEVLELIRERASSTFYFNPFDKKLSERFLQNFKSEYLTSLRLAESYLTGKFTLLGRMFNFEDWHTINGKRWPLQKSSTIGYFGKKRIDDIKIIWELNRMQFLPILGKMYFLTGDERYVRKVLWYMKSWIKQNPYLVGVNWMEGIESAIRMYSWIFSYYFILSSNQLNETINNEILRTIYQHGKFMYDFLSDKWTINNNHILAELSGLLLISLAFPEFNDSRKWREFSIDKLKKELKVQIFEDGATWEHSTGYHKFVLELITYPLILMQKQNQRIPNKILKKMEKMYEFLNYVSIKNGKIPLIGDEDQGFVLKLNDWEYDDIRDISSVGSIFLDRPDFIHHKSELVFWLFDGLVINSEKNSFGYPSFKMFSNSGYSVFKTQNSYLLFVTSAQDKRYLHSGHRHLDMLSFIYEHNGDYVIVDPGTYTYYSDDILRNRFRSIFMHNTIVVDDKNPSDLSGLFELYPRPYAQIVKHGTINGWNYVWAKHDGYKPLIHNRIILNKKEHFVIYDWFEKSNELHKFTGYLHLHPSVEIEAKNPNVHILKTKTQKTEVYSNIPMEPTEAMFSPKYGILEKTRALKYEIKCKKFENIIGINADEKDTISIKEVIAEITFSRRRGYED